MERRCTSSLRHDPRPISLTRVKAHATAAVSIDPAILPPGPRIPAVSPHGRVYLAPLHADADDLGTARPSGPLAERIEHAFQKGQGHGVLHLGAAEVSADLPPDFAYFRDLGRRFVTALRSIPDAEEERDALHVLPPDDLAMMAVSAPPLLGAEYLNEEALVSLWADMEQALHAELQETRESVGAYLKRQDPLWNLVGRVGFHLVENKGNQDAPFAFMATYSTRLSQARVKHLPLGKALKEYAGSQNRNALLSLLLPVQRAAEHSPLLKDLLDSREVFEAQEWTPKEAYRFLKDVQVFEEAGVIVRVPDFWRARRSSRPQVSITVGKKDLPSLGMQALLDFSVAVTLDGETLSEAEVRHILEGADGLVLLKGRWVEVDRDRLKEALSSWKAAHKAAAREGISFVDAMRLLAGAQGAMSGGGSGSAIDQAAGRADPEWSQVVAGPFLKEVLDKLRGPEGLSGADPGPGLLATLRPYQKVGVRWLAFLTQLGLGACLADDMGLGKTLQVLALLLLIQKEQGDRLPSLLVAPTSLLSNWQGEIERFTPGLSTLIAHPSVLPSAEVARLTPADLARVDLVLTSYGSVHRFPIFAQAGFRLVILDEAQAIKNPAARQTRAVKAILGRARIALTGTPVENRLSDLWSIFDFLCPGLLGSTQVFGRFAKRLSQGDRPNYGPLRELIRPYILRRLKSDRRIIADLPDKTELYAYCSLGKKQAALYRQAVDDLTRQIQAVDGIQRRGLILSFLLRFKQLCNHPSQWLGDGGYDPEESGKFIRLRELCEAIASRQEKALVFTQFREMTGPLCDYLTQVFGRPGLVLHGATQVKQRHKLVESFQSESGPPFFVLSLKAGGTGLNLTAASHVIHFDRWWNPAVEGQASDRAYRIGQKRNVLVHKFVCRGTVEEKIDALIVAKQGMAKDLVDADGGDGGALLTEMNDEDLLRLVSLDIKSAVGESGSGEA